MLRGKDVTKSFVMKIAYSCTLSFRLKIMTQLAIMRNTNSIFSNKFYKYSSNIYVLYLKSAFL